MMKIKLKIIQLFTNFQIKLIKLVLFLMGFLFLLIPLLTINQKKYPNFAKNVVNQTFEDSFDKSFFVQETDNKGYFLKNKFNNFFVQLSQYFQAKPIEKNELLHFNYKKLFNLLPNIWRKFNKEFQIPKNKNTPEQFIKVFFEFVLSHEGEYKIMDFLNILLSILNSFKKLNNKPKFKSLFTLPKIEKDSIESSKRTIKQLISVMEAKNNEEDKKIVLQKITEEKQKDINSFLKTPFFQFLGIEEQNNAESSSSKLLLKISTVKEPKYSENLKIQQEIKELERGDYKAILDFDIRFLPLKFDFGFDNEFNYLSFMNFISQTLKFIYLKIIINAKNDQELSFTDFLDSSWNIQDDKTLLEIQNDFTKIVFATPFDIEIKTDENVWTEKKNKYLFDLLEILITNKYKNKFYFDINTKKCKDDVLIEIPINQLLKLLTGLNDFQNNNGGFCRVKKSEDNNGQKDNGLETFKLFSLIENLQDWIDKTSKTLEGYSDSLDNQQKTQLKMLKKINLKDELKKNMMKSFISFIDPKQIFETSKMIKQELHENLQKLSKIQIDDSDNQDRTIRFWTLLTYDALFQNFVILENDLIDKFNVFKNHNNQKITKMLKYNRIDTSIDWKKFYFQVEHCFTKKDKNTGKKVLVLMLIENNKKKTKHTFVLKQTNTGYKLIYYALNHYEYLLNDFLNKYKWDEN